jgi:hypothetical protein
MPRGDGTGPAGIGPMTGRAAGYCAGYNVPGFMNPAGGRMGMGYGRGFGRGMGWGRGWRFGGYPGSVPYGSVPYGAVPYGVNYSPEQEAESLKTQAKYLQDEIEAIQKRLSELETETKKSSK